MAVFSLHHGHMPAQPNDLLDHLRGLRQGSTQHPFEACATMPKRSRKGSCSPSSDVGSSQSNTQVTTDSSGVEESASGSASSESPDKSEASDQSRAKSQRCAADAATLQTQAAKTKQALFQDLDVVLSTRSKPGMLRRKKGQASPPATCAGVHSVHECLVRVP